MTQNTNQKNLKIMTATLPEFGFLRLDQIVGNQKKGIPAIIPIGRSSWWAGVKSGKYPKPIKLGPGTTVWIKEEIFNTYKEICEADANN